MYRQLSTALIFLALVSTSALGQGTFVYDVTSPGVFEQHYLDSAAYPDGVPSPTPLYPAPAAGALPPAIFPFGAMASDDTTATIYTTDGGFMSTDFNGVYLPFTAPPPVAAPAPILLPAGWPAVSGLAVDSAGGVLWACDPISFAPYPLAPPYVPLAATIPIPTPAAGIIPIVGLGFESSTGSLWAVDAGGAVFNFTTAGVPIGPQPVTVVPSIVGFLFNGLTVNTSNGPGSFPAPGCSMQTGSQHVTITDGVFIYDAVPGIAPPMPIVTGSGLGTVGLAYSSDPQTLPGFAGCPSSGATPVVGTIMPNYTGPGAFNGLAITGATPLSTILLAADVCPIPGGAGLISGETLHVSPFSPGFVSGSFLTDGFGSAFYPISWVPVPAGVQFTCQWAIPDPAAPLGACLSDAITVTTGLP